ncbi:MAG TPA: hypothetical protein VLA34_15585, partial [Candidatus Krumholzibacterium sp.]|nr:hypothetical protein [Candidatus Krumholzibacterium sp.]
PGEDDESFDRTRTFLRNAPIDYFHVFSYSIRPGTPAARMKDQVAPQKKKSRSASLIRIGREKRKRFMISQVGKRCLLLMQGKKARYSRYHTGMTGNYCEVQVQCGGECEGKLREAKITRYGRGRLYGELV